VRVIGVDEHRWSHTRRTGDDGYVTVVIDLTLVLEDTGRVWLLDLVAGWLRPVTAVPRPGTEDLGDAGQRQN
jgi:hypothetical protein